MTIRRNGKRATSLLGAAASVMAAAAMSAPNLARAEGPSNELQSQHYTFENVAGGNRCKPKGLLANLMTEQKCYLDLMDCEASASAVKGKLDGTHAALFKDLLAQNTEPKLSWKLACDGDGPQYLYKLGIVGLGLMRQKDALPELAGLAADKAHVKELSGDDRAALVQALWWLGDAKAVPTFESLLTADARMNKFKYLALQYLARWKSDGAVEYCTKALSREKDDRLVASCIGYLGERKARGAVPMLQRTLEKHPEETARALGLIGGGAAKKALESALSEAEKKPPRLRMPILVALMNAGDASGWSEMALYLKGQKPEKKKKAGKKRKKKKARAKKPDDKLIQAAAMESVLVSGKMSKKVSAALKAATKMGDAKAWKGALYANVALAQRGDAKAAKKLAEEINNPKDQIRMAVIDAIGGRDDVPHANWMNRGIGVVTSESVIPALLSFYDAEAKPKKREKALLAVANIRAAAAAQTGKSKKKGKK